MRADVRLALIPARVAPGRIFRVSVDAPGVRRVLIRFAGAPAFRGRVAGPDWSELPRLGPGRFGGRTAAPDVPGMYPVELMPERRGRKRVLSDERWLLRVASPKFFRSPGFPTAIAAARSGLSLIHVPTRFVSIVRKRPPHDARDARLNRVYRLTFDLLRTTPDLPEGRHTYSAEVLRDGFDGPWRLRAFG